MNQGRIWCVVHPTVGLPLLLGSVAATSLIVHASIMTHTTWMDSYWMGSRARVAQTSSLTPQARPAAFQAGPGFALTVAPAPANGTAQAAYVITVTPTGKAATPPIHTASAN